jgi:hypothetical protein
VPTQFATSASQHDVLLGRLTGGDGVDCSLLFLTWCRENSLNAWLENSFQQVSVFQNQSRRIVVRDIRLVKNDKK